MIDQPYLQQLLQQRQVHLDLNQEHLVSALPLPTFHIHCFDTVSSTNQILWELIEQGADEGTVAIALQQQAGRGQWGRQWQSPLGGLYLSLALAPKLAADQSGQLTLCSAWGIAAALRQYGIPVLLKWPNDLVVSQQKLGGILIETRLQQGQIQRAIVGVGINWANPVPPTGVNLQTLLAQQPQPAITSLEMIAAIAIQGTMVAYRLWQQHGIEALLPHYEALLVNVGQQVRVGADLGIIAGVSTRGELRVHLHHQDDADRPSSVCLQPGAIRLGYGNSGTE